MKNKIEIMSRETMMNLIDLGFPADTAVISFFDPPKERGLPRFKNYKPLDYRGICEHVFSVGIHDIDLEILGDYGLTFDAYFPEAPALAAFIHETIEAGMNIICQCEYGQSRSAACAAAIKEHFEKSGIEVFSDYRYYPNQLIFNKLRAELDKVKALQSCKKGPFWVITDEQRIVSYPVSQTEIPVPSHIDVWKTVSNSKKAWNYYPRGRVEIKRGKAIVFANSLCFEFEKLEGYLRFYFNLGDMPIEYKTDNSSHYTNGVFED